MTTEQVGSIARYGHHLEDRPDDELGGDNYSFTLHSGVISVAPCLLLTIFVELHLGRVLRK